MPTATDKYRITAVIPAFNEEESIGRVVTDALQSSIDGVIVVDDCSTENTSKIARSAGATVINLVENIGAWPATQAGLRFAVSRGVNPVVTLDADGQHCASAIAELLEPIMNGTANTVVGACQERGNRRRHAAWAWLRTLSGLSIGDITSGMRAYDFCSLKVLTSESATSLDYQDVGLLLLMRRHGLTITEVPVNMAQREVGKSRIFNSWLRVADYMWYSTVLSITKRHYRRKSKFGDAK